MNKSKIISIVGASGLVGSSIVRCALQRGYIVNGTLRDNNNIENIMSNSFGFGGTNATLIFSKYHA